MWRLVREGLRIYWPVLLSAWGIATVAGIVVPAGLALFSVLSLRAAISWPQTGWPLSIVLSSAIAGWIVLGAEMAEHRLRLHLLLPLPLREVGLAQLLLPAVMMFLGLVVAHATAVVADLALAAATSIGLVAPDRWHSHAWINLIAVHLLLLVQQSFAIREIARARETGRWKALSASIVPAIMLFAQVWLIVRLDSPGLEAVTVLAMTGLLMAHTLALFSRRSQFAR